MATRSYQNQSFHDRVIEIASGYLDRNSYTVYTNPNGYKNIGVGNHYPDIILTSKGSNTVTHIIEVETEDSVTAAEALNQWMHYAKLGGTFYILVPQSHLSHAKNLCSSLHITAKFASYAVVNGQLHVNYES